MQTIRRLPYNIAFADAPEIRECWRVLRRNGIPRKTAAIAFGISDTTARKADKATRCPGCGEFATSDDSELDQHAQECWYVITSRRRVADSRLHRLLGAQLDRLTLRELTRTRREMADAEADALAEQFPPLGRDDVQQVWRDQRKNIIEWLETEPDTYFDFTRTHHGFDAPPPPVRLAAEGVLEINSYCSVTIRN